MNGWQQHKIRVEPVGGDFGFVENKSLSACTDGLMLGKAHTVLLISHKCPIRDTARCKSLHTIQDSVPRYCTILGPLLNSKFSQLLFDKLTHRSFFAYYLFLSFCTVSSHQSPFALPLFFRFVDLAYSDCTCTT